MTPYFRVVVQWANSILGAFVKSYLYQASFVYAWVVRLLILSTLVCVVQTSHYRVSSNMVISTFKMAFALNTASFMALFSMCTLTLSADLSRGLGVPDRNAGDPYGFFVFSLPDLYRNATVGPEVWRWLADRYGAAHLVKGGVRRAPTNFHICGDGPGWCRDQCRPAEVIEWKYKDICGRYYCCIDNLQ